MERHIAQIFQMSQTAASPTGLRGHLVLFRAGTERKLELDCVEITIKNVNKSQKTLILYLKNYLLKNLFVST